MRGGTKLGEGEGSKLGEPCPNVRLSQDSLPILRTNVVSANVTLGKCHSTLDSNLGMMRQVFLHSTTLQVIGKKIIGANVVGLELSVPAKPQVSLRGPY